MFTGIVSGLGLLVERRGSKIKVSAPYNLCEKLLTGQSIAVNGVCLTIYEPTDDTFTASLSPETSARSTLGQLRARTRVNLERAVSPEQSLDGHIVLGHVDTTGKVEGISKEREGWSYAFSYPPEFGRYVVEKGSIAIDGISLTPFRIAGGTFRCAVIRETYESTNLKDRAAGDPVNIEFDILAKYVERMATGAH